MPNFYLDIKSILFLVQLQSAVRFSRSFSIKGKRANEDNFKFPSQGGNRKDRRGEGGTEREKWSGWFGETARKNKIQEKNKKKKKRKALPSL